MPYVSRPRASHNEAEAVVRDFQAIPYRKTPAYKRALEAANAQRAKINHRVGTLWPSENGQSTSGVLRRVGLR